MTTPANAANAAPNAGLGRLYYLEFTIPAATPILAPVSLPWPLEDNYLIEITSRIPPGPSGMMGFKIMWAQQQIVPWGNNSWLIANDEEIVWRSETAMTSSGLVVEGYNTGVFPHTVYLRALISTLPPAVQAAVDTATGTIALPASQVGPDTGDVNNYVAPLPDDSGETDTGDTEEIAPEDTDIEIPASVSLVAAS